MLRASLRTVGILAVSVSALPASDPGDRRVNFGATVVVSGDMAYIADPRGATAGVIKLYRRGPTGWKAAGEIASPDGTPNDGFGHRILVQGNTMLVTRMGLNNHPDSLRGAVFAFRRTPAGAWVADGMVGQGGKKGDRFGQGLALDGDVAMVGASFESGGPGMVHLYRRTGDGSWQASGTLSGRGAKDGERFGHQLAVEGNLLVVTSPFRDSTKGGIYTFTRTAGGPWQQEALVATSRRTPANGGLGLSVALRGGKLVAGAPQADGFSGMVAVFERNGANSAWVEKHSFAPFETTGQAQFGTVVAFAGDEIWVGAQGATATGAVYRLRAGRDGSYGAMEALAVPGIEPGAGFGGALSASGNTAAVGMPFDASGEGTVTFLTRGATGAWTVSGTVYPPQPAAYARHTGAEVQCAGGKTKDFNCGNTGLMAFLPIAEIGGKRGTRLNDNWGWTDPLTGREYALVGRTDGTSFVDITNPGAPKYLGDLPKTKGSPSAAWRDIKTYRNHAFIVADNSAEHGMQVFDLTRLRGVRTPQTFAPDVRYDEINSAHNIVINEESGYAYAVGASGGGTTCGGGLHMIDIREPKKPTFAGCFGDSKTGINKTGYSHDAQCVTYRGPDEKYKGREICIGSNETAISIADVTDKKNPVAISHAAYPNVSYAHQGWFTDDHRFFYLDDEGDEQQTDGEATKGTRTLVWDLSDLDDPVLVKQHVGTTKAIDHNLYVKGNRMYQANYTSGLRILDISDPKNPREVGFMDTYPTDDSTTFNGAWSTYPYFKSGNILVTSIGEGLFIVKDRTAVVP